MKGCKALEKNEVKKIMEYLNKQLLDENNKHALRDKCLFYLLTFTGLRIQESLLLKKNDIFKNGKVLKQIYIPRKNTKGKSEGKDVDIHPRLKKNLEKYILTLDKDQIYLFESQQKMYKDKKLDKPMTTRRATQILKDIFKKCKIEGGDRQLGCHTLRKTYAKTMYKSLGKDMLALKDAMHHKSLDSTCKYIQANREKVKSAILNAKY